METESKYITRVKEVALGLSGNIHGFDSAAYYMCDYIDAAKFCLEKMAEEYGNGLLRGHEMVTGNSITLPSELLVEQGLIPEF